MNFEKKFDSLKKEFSKYDTAAVPADMAIQVTMSDEDCGGTFYVATVDGEFAVEPYDYRDNTVAIRATADTLEKLINGKLSAEEAIEDGTVTAFGAFEHVTGLFGNLKKKPAKKATKKKTTKKKAAKKAAPKKTAKKVEKKVEKKAEPKVEKKAEKKAEPKKAAPKKTTVKKTAAKKTASKKTSKK